MKFKFLLSSCVLLLFAILAGGSFSDDDLKAYLWIILGSIAFIAALIIITALAESDNKKNKKLNKQKRLAMIKDEESKNTDLYSSVSFGNDHCRFYFDASKRQVVIMMVTTDGITHTIVSDFEYSGKQSCYQDDPYFCIYDYKNHKILTGKYEGMETTYVVNDITAKDKNINIVPNCTIEPRIVNARELTCTLIDESHGLMAIIRKDKLTSVFNYIAGERLSQKTGDKSYVVNQRIGNYHFTMDNFFNILVIITPSSYQVFNYSDIIEVSYEENGTQLYSKSTLRTVGGAIVGGALMGGAGAVVGGLSGSTKKNMEIKSIQIKILLRHTQRTNFILEFNDTKRVLNTKDSTDEILYNLYLKNANRAKDLLSVIIDQAKQNGQTGSQKVVPQLANETTLNESTPLTGIADELAKLAKLKENGILTDEEFKAQKAKLLNS
jgi:hypothetical protein